MWYLNSANYESVRRQEITPADWLARSQNLGAIEVAAIGNGTDTDMLSAECLLGLGSHDGKLCAIRSM